MQGIPVGFRINRVGKPDVGEWCITVEGKAHKRIISTGYYNCNYPVLEWANTYQDRDLTTIPVPEGYEYDGANVFHAYREIEEGDIYITTDNNNLVTYGPDARPNSGFWRIVVRKIKPKTRKVVFEFDAPVEACELKAYILWTGCTGSLQGKVIPELSEC